MGNRTRTSKSRHDAGLATHSVHGEMESDAGIRTVQRPLVMSNNYEIPPSEGYAAIEFTYAHDLHPNARWLEERLNEIRMKGTT